jgi:hypothetical protein
MPGMMGRVGGGDPGSVGGPGGGAAGTANKAPDFRDPYKSAQSFLDAVKAKDPVRLAECVALRSRNEAAKNHREMFDAMLERTADPSTLDELADTFEGMTIVGANDVKSTGSRGIICSKRKENVETRRTLVMRREKAGWKVLDYGGAIVNKDFKTRQPGSNRR